MTSRLSLGLLAFLLASCASDDRSAGGGGIEIPNGIDMAVTDSVGAPIAAARVLVLAGDDWASLVSSSASPVLDSALTDANGKVRLPAREGRWWIEVEAASGGARASSLDGSNLSLVLAATAPLAGQIPPESPRPKRMRLAGTDRVATVDASGRFYFPAVIRGSYALVAEGVGANGPIPAGTAVVDSAGVRKIAVHLDTSALLLDDFSDGDVAWSLRDVFGVAYWWLTANDSAKKIFGIATASEAIQSDSTSRWMGVKVSNAEGTLSWANFGLDLGLPTHRLPSLAHLAAVRMRVRGSGKWSLLLNVDNGGESLDWNAPLTLDSTTWTTVRIPVSAFTASTSNVPLANVRLRNFVFWTNAAGAIDIDDIALEGVSLQDWVLP